MAVVLAFLVNTLINFAVGLIVAKYLGPEEYGRFALAIGLMTFGQALAFDWIRVASVRFYSQQARTERPQVRATLDASFAIVAALFGLGALVLFALGRDFVLPNILIGLALAASVSNGLFDYTTALVRARFDDKLYWRLIVTKNCLAIVLTAGGAILTGSAAVALIAGVSSLIGSIGLWRGALSDPKSGPERASLDLAREYLRYALPVVGAGVLYYFIPLANRLFAAHFFGFAETGQFSLAYDLGVRAVQAIGSTLDVLLFQIAVRAHDQGGEAKARAQIAANISIVYAVLLPACVGLWATLPSVERLIVPFQYRGPFAHFLALMLPGLFCQAMIQFAISSIFQIGKKTTPLIIAALAASIADPIFVALAPQAADASYLALAQSLAMVVALATLLAFACKTAPQWPPLRDIALISLGSALMAGALWPLRGMEPGVLALFVQVCVGAGVYALVVAPTDAASLRSLAVGKIAQWRARRA